MKKVSVIEATAPKENRIRRVGAYCRVSTDHADQQQSLQAQRQHYTNTIAARPDWELVDVYADEGVSGRSVQRRPEFQRMIQDAESGKLDLILTKSVSRLARNVADCLETVRTLRGWNVEVHLEQENLWTLQADGELMLSILGSVAEEESASISANTKWAIIRHFQTGKYKVQTKRFLGYDYDADGDLVIHDTEAAIVRRIFAEYLAGKGAHRIAKGLTKDGVPRVCGGTQWTSSVILSMLKNEKHAGDAILQKTVTVGTKRRRNTGEAPTYVVKDSHPAIISRVDFDSVQALVKERSEARGDTPGQYQKRYPFTGKIVCGQCGKTFKHTIHNGKQAYWACRSYVSQGVNVCSMKPIKDDTVKRLFVRLVHRLLEVPDLVDVQPPESDRLRELDTAIDELLQQETGFFRLQVDDPQNQTLWQQEHQDIVRRITDLQTQRAQLTEENQHHRQLRATLKALNEPAVVFDEGLFAALVESIQVPERECLVFQLHGGLEFEERYTFHYGEDIL